MARAVRAYAGQLPVLLGVSGGRDSMCLWDVIRGAGIAHGVAHVDYGLRGADSDADREFVVATAREHAVACHLARPSPLGGGGAGLQAHARDLRLAFFHELRARHGYGAVLLAHHADDQLETVLAGLVRGGGPRAVGGMSVWTPPLLRPLLQCSGAELDEYAARRGVAFRTDASNATDAYLRNRIRHHVVPAVRAARDGAQAGCLRSAAEVREAFAFAEAQLEPLLERCRVGGQPNRLARVELTATPGLGFVLFELTRAARPGHPQIEAAKKLVSTAEADAAYPRRRAVPIGRQWRLVAAGDAVWLERAGRVAPMTHTLELLREAPERELVLSSREHGSLRVSAAKGGSAREPECATAALWVRPGQVLTWRTAARSDRIRAGRGRRTRVRSVLAQAHWPSVSQGAATVVTLDGEVAWVPGLRAATPPPSATGSAGFELALRLEPPPGVAPGGALCLPLRLPAGSGSV